MKWYNTFSSNLGLFLIVLFWAFSAQAQKKVNSKKNCIYTSWHVGVGKSNDVYFNLERSFAFRKVRKVNAFNKSEFTYLGLGVIGHMDEDPDQFIFGPTAQLQAGFAKFLHLWPTARYTYLVNDSKNAHRFSLGLSYLPLKNCGLHYEYSLPEKNGQQLSLEHHFGIAINIRTKKKWCGETKKKDKKKSKKK